MKKAAAKKTKTLELTLTVTGTADGERHAELKQDSTYLARNLAVAAAAVPRAANELHEKGRNARLSQMHAVRRGRGRTDPTSMTVAGSQVISATHR